MSPQLKSSFPAVQRGYAWLKLPLGPLLFGGKQRGAVADADAAAGATATRMQHATDHSPQRKHLLRTVNVPASDHLAPLLVHLSQQAAAAAANVQEAAGYSIAATRGAGTAAHAALPG